MEAKKEQTGRILTLQEAADRLHVSYSTAYRMVMDGELEAFRVRNSWRTSEAVCDGFIARRFAEQALQCETAEEA